MLAEQYRHRLGRRPRPGRGPLLGAQPARAVRRPGAGGPGRGRGAARAPAAADQQARRRRPVRCPSRDRRRRRTSSSSSSSGATPRCSRTRSTSASCRARRDAAAPRRAGAAVLRPPAGLPGDARATSPTRSPASPTCTTRPTSTSHELFEPARGRAAAGLFTGQRRGEFLDLPRRPPRAGSRGAGGGPAAGQRGAPEPAAARAGRRGGAASRGVPPAGRAAGRRTASCCGRWSAPGAARRKQASSWSAGPGSGKSVIALSLLGELSRQGRIGAARDRLLGLHPDAAQGRRRAGPRGSGRCSATSTSSASSSRTSSTCCCATRRTASARRPPTGTRGRSARTGTPQVDELLQAARVPVFLLDEHQVVRPGELGSVARDHGAPQRGSASTSSVVELDGQYRCGGSRAYETWVLRLLGLEPGGPDAPGRATSTSLLGRRQSPQQHGGRAARAAGRGLQRAHQRRVLLAVGRRRVPDGSLPEDVVGRRVAAALEQQEGHLGRRGAGPAVLVQRPGRLRSGRLRLHRAGLRVRLVGRHPGPGPRPARPTAGSRSRARATTRR